jgi:hypothetical protein
LVLATSVILIIRSGRGLDATFGLAPVLFTALGALILSRQPGNRIAWILLLVGAGLLFEPAALPRYADGPPIPVTVGDVLLLTGLNTSFFTVFIIPIGLLLFLFPTGKFLSRRWWWGGWFAGISIVGSLAGIFNTVIAFEFPGNEWTVSNPIGVLPESLEGIRELVYGVTMLTLLVGGVVAIVIRYRRSNDVVRAQIKWVGLSLILFVLAILSRFFTYPEPNVAAEVLFTASVAFIPVSMTLAILRYRLFDIDRLISRTVGYAIVVSILALVYVVGAVWLPTRLIGDQSPLFVAGSTLATAALFNPLRRRVTFWIDRRFNRGRYDAEQVLARLSERLNDEIVLDQIAADSIAVISQTMQPSSVGIWIRE